MNNEIAKWESRVHNPAGTGQSQIQAMLGEIRDLRFELDQAAAYSPECSADTKRLDFVIDNEVSWYPGYYDGSWKPDSARGTLCFGRARTQVEGIDMREAIDAAITSIAPTQIKPKL